MRYCLVGAMIVVGLLLMPAAAQPPDGAGKPGDPQKKPEVAKKDGEKQKDAKRDRAKGEKRKKDAAGKKGKAKDRHRKGRDGDRRPQLPEFILEAIFNHFDADHDGKLSKDEFKKLTAFVHEHMRHMHRGMGGPGGPRSHAGWPGGPPRGGEMFRAQFHGGGPGDRDRRMEQIRRWRERRPGGEGERWPPRGEGRRRPEGPAGPGRPSGPPPKHAERDGAI